MYIFLTPHFLQGYIYPVIIKRDTMAPVLLKFHSTHSVQVKYVNNSGIITAKTTTRIKQTLH